MRNLRRHGAAAVLLMSGLLLVGCGTSDPGPEAGPSTSLPSPSPSAPASPAPSSPAPSSPAPSSPASTDPSVPPAEDAAQLTVDYSSDGTARETWTLTCAPNGGTHPDPATACAALAAAGTEPFQPISTDTQCTQVYGGPQTATVKGTWRGQSIAGTFTRANGCQIDRWSQLEGLLPAA